MKVQKRGVSTWLKQKLKAEAGGKCANPGCANQRTEIHHIQEWSVYKTHDQAHMIAVCPACHDAAHNGPLKISDETIYRWKGLPRPSRPPAATLHVDPADLLRIKAGNVYLDTHGKAITVFDLLDGNSLAVSVLDGDILRVSARFVDERGVEIARIVENVVRPGANEELTCFCRPGRVKVSLPLSANYISSQVVDKLRSVEANYCEDGNVIVLDVEVLEPGTISILGCWPAAGGAVVITSIGPSFVGADGRRITIVGNGATIKCDPSQIGNTLFNVIHSAPASRVAAVGG